MNAGRRRKKQPATSAWQYWQLRFRCVIFLPVSFMSSISGRFCTVWDHGGGRNPVSLLVSSRAPMMSSRLFASTTPRVVRLPNSHGLLSLDRCWYSRVLALRCTIDWRLDTAWVIATSLPLYRSVKQEFIPTNVDEAEFEVNINGPEGTNLAVMNEAMEAIEKEILATPGVRLVLSNAGGGFVGGVNQGGAYVRIAPHEERTLSLTRLWNATKKGNPFNAFKGNYGQQDVMQEVRSRLRKFAPMRTGFGRAVFQLWAGGRYDIDFVFAV